MSSPLSNDSTIISAELLSLCEEIDLDFWDKVFTENPVPPENGISLTNQNEMALDKNNGHEDNNHAASEGSDQQEFDASSISNGLHGSFSDDGASVRTPTPPQCVASGAPEGGLPCHRSNATTGDEDLNCVPLNTTCSGQFLQKNGSSLLHVNEMNNSHEDHNYYRAAGEVCNEQYVDTRSHSDDLEEGSLSDYGALGRTSTTPQSLVMPPVGGGKASRKRKGSNGDQQLKYVPIHTMFQCGVSDVIPTSFQFESSSSTPTSLTDQQSPDVASHLDPKKRRLNKRRDAAVVRRAKTKEASGEGALLIASMVNRAKALTPEQRDTLPGRLNQLINGESCDAEFFGGFCEEDNGKLEKWSEELRELQSALENGEKYMVKMESRLVLKRKKVGKPILEAEAQAVHQATSKEQLIAELNQLQDMNIYNCSIDTIRENADRLGILCLVLKLQLRNTKQLVKRLDIKKADYIRRNKLDELMKVEHLYWLNF